MKHEIVPPDAPDVVRETGTRLLKMGAGAIGATILILWLNLGLLGILVTCVTSIGGLVAFFRGWGVLHGAVWAMQWLPADARERPDVLAYYWGDEHCPGCGAVHARETAFCATCGHGLNPPEVPFWAGAKFALRRAFKAQDPEPARTVAFKKRAAHETSDKYLIAAVAAIPLGWFASNTFASLSRLGVTIGVIVPAVLMLVWLRKQDRFEAEPWNLLLIAFGWGMLCGVFVIPMNSLVISFTGMAQVAGVTEELAKAAIVLLYATHRTLRKEVNGPTDGLIYAAAAGLGFAAMENFGYVINIWMGSGDLLAGFALRSVGIVNHMMYAGITGSFLGLMLLRNGRVTPRDLVIGIVPGGLVHALNNSMGLFGPLALVVIFVPTALAGWAFFKLLAEHLRDEALWGYGAGAAPVEEH